MRDSVRAGFAELLTSVFLIIGLVSSLVLPLAVQYFPGAISDCCRLDLLLRFFSLVASSLILLWIFVCALVCPRKDALFTILLSFLISIVANLGRTGSCPSAAAGVNGFSRICTTMLPALCYALALVAFVANQKALILKPGRRAERVAGNAQQKGAV